MRWSVRPSLAYTIVGVPSDALMTKVVTKMAQARPLAAGTVISDATEIQKVEYLKTLSVAENLGMSRWRLTDHSSASLQPCHVLTDPLRVCEPRPGVAESEMSLLELHKAMEHDGWANGGRIGLGKLRPHCPGVDKIWYGKAVQTRIYFRCLLQAQRLFAKGCCGIRHGTTVGYYKRLLKGLQTGNFPRHEGPLRRPRARGILQEDGEGAPDDAPVPQPAHALAIEDEVHEEQASGDDMGGSAANSMSSRSDSESGGEHPVPPPEPADVPPPPEVPQVEELAMPDDAPEGDEGGENFEGIGPARRIVRAETLQSWGGDSSASVGGHHQLA